MKKSSLSAAVAAVALAGAAFTIIPAPAHAGGLLDDILEKNCGNCGVGKALDKALDKKHEETGRRLIDIDDGAHKSMGRPATPFIMPG